MIDDVQPCKTPLVWYGGKKMLAGKLLPLLPQHTCYVEVFGGSGAVLFRKQPAKLEIYNDLNADVVNFFRVLREQPDKLIEALELTPYSRAEYNTCTTNYQAEADPIERARRFYVGIYQSFNSKFANGWRGSTNRDFAGSWRNAIDMMPEAIARLRPVVIECLHYRDLLPKYDKPGVCWYLDPPYVTSTRVSKDRYDHEMTDDDHVELLTLANSLQGKVIISGYESELYNKMLDDWRRVDIESVSHATINPKGKRAKRIESVWLNY